MKNGFVSIICACYNSASYIESTILSILSQTYEDWELIIIDDCSKDNSVAIIKKYIDRSDKIKLLINEKNLGPGLSRNKGINCAIGQYIAICDSDDIWYPEKLKIQVNFMNDKKVPISYTSYELINSEGLKLNKVIRVVNRPIGYTDYLKNTVIGFSTSMIDRFKCPKIEFANLRSREDTLLWCNLFKTGVKASGIDIVLVGYRIHGASISSNKFKATKQVWDLYTNQLKLPFHKKIYYYCSYLFNAVKKRFF